MQDSIYDIVCHDECLYRDSIYCTHDYDNISPNYNCIHKIEVLKTYKTPTDK